VWEWIRLNDVDSRLKLLFMHGRNVRCTTSNVWCTVGPTVFLNSQGSTLKILEMLRTFGQGSISNVLDMLQTFSQG